MVPGGLFVFWEAFLPNFVATICGVALGLPVALYVNKKLSEKQSNHATSVTTKKFGEATDVIVRSLNYNKNILRSISELCMTAQVMRNPDLQLTTWDAVGGYFTSICHDPEIIQLLSHHWLRLNRLYIINKEMFDRTSGDLPEITDQEMHLKMWGELYQLSNDLLSHADRLIEHLNITRNSLLKGLSYKDNKNTN